MARGLSAQIATFDMNLGSVRSPTKRSALGPSERGGSHENEGRRISLFRQWSEFQAILAPGKTDRRTRTYAHLPDGLFAPNFRGTCPRGIGALRDRPTSEAGREEMSKRVVTMQARTDICKCGHPRDEHGTCDDGPNETHPCCQVYEKCRCMNFVAAGAPEEK
jgi:hypothetical protein